MNPVSRNASTAFLPVSRNASTAFLHNVTLIRRACVGGLAVLTIALAGCSSDEPQWRDLNQRVIDENKVTGRTRELPDVSVPMVLKDGEPVERNKLPVITIAP